MGYWTRVHLVHFAVMYGPVPSCYTCESDLYPDVNLMWVWKATSQILGKWASSGWRRCCQMQNSSQLLAIVTANVYLWNNEFVTVTAQFLNLAFELQWLSALNNVQLCQAKELSWKIFCVTRSVDLDRLTLSNSEEKKSDFYRAVNLCFLEEKSIIARTIISPVGCDLVAVVILVMTL